jgi:hypothetical protein
LIEKPGKGVFLLQKKIAERKFLKARKQYPLAIEPREMIEPRPQPRRHVPPENQSEETELMMITTDEDSK